MAEILALRAVSLAFGGLKVLGGVSLSAAAGELLALIGPNGAGKTSLLNCISGIYRPTGGAILLEGTRLDGRPPHAIAAAGIARTFQHGELFDSLSVLDNVLVARHGRVATRLAAEGFRTGSVRAAELAHREAVEAILDFVELGRFRHRPVGTLPFGVQKIVGFARALALEPRVLLLDEPSAGLNREERENLARYILRIRHEMKIAILWVEHDMQMVADLADRLYVLDHGEYLTDGPPEVVLKDPRVVEAWLGSAATPG